MCKVEEEVLNVCTAMKISLNEYRKTPKHHAVNNEGSEIVETTVEGGKVEVATSSIWR